MLLQMKVHILPTHAISVTKTCWDSRGGPSDVLSETVAVVSHRAATLLEHSEQSARTAQLGHCRPAPSWIFKNSEFCSWRCPSPITHRL